MSDYIKREDALKAMDTWDKFGCDGHGRLVPYTEEYVPYVKFDDMMKAIEGQPSADVTPVRHGRWIVGDSLPMCDIAGIPAWGNWYTCNQCEFKTYAIEGHITQYNYCPNCGAKMDGKNGDED